MIHGGVESPVSGMQWFKLTWATFSDIVLRDAIALAQHGCRFGWAAQVFRCFAEHGKPSPLLAGAPVAVRPNELLLAFQMQQQATCEYVPLDPQSCPDRA